MCDACNDTGVVEVYDGPTDWVLVHEEPCPDPLHLLSDAEQNRYEDFMRGMAP